MSKCVGLAQEIGFSAPDSCSLPWLVKGATQLCTSKTECNKLDLTAAQYFLLNKQDEDKQDEQETREGQELLQTKDKDENNKQETGQAHVTKTKDKHGESEGGVGSSCKHKKDKTNEQKGGSYYNKDEDKCDEQENGKLL